MLLVVGLVALLGYVGAQTPASAGCCVASKFTTTMLQLSATLAAGSSNPDIHDGYITLDYDYDSKMSKLDINELDQATGVYFKMTVINDYPNDKTYTETGGKCFITPMNGTGVMTPPCVPRNATFLHTYKLGGGSSALTVDVWGGMAQGQNLLIHLTPGTCTPIMQSTYGDTADGSREMNNYLFANVLQNQLSSPITVPALCKTSGISATGGRKRSVRSAFS